MRIISHPETVREMRHEKLVSQIAEMTVRQCVLYSRNENHGDKKLLKDVISRLQEALDVTTNLQRTAGNVQNAV